MRRTLACIFVFAALGSGLMRLHAQRVQYPAGSLGEYESMRAGVTAFGITLTNDIKSGQQDGYRDSFFVTFFGNELLS